MIFLRWAWLGGLDSEKTSGAGIDNLLNKWKFLLFMVISDRMENNPGNDIFFMPHQND